MVYIFTNMAPLAQVITPSYDALATYTQLTN